jgi:hypothetical protein
MEVFANIIASVASFYIIMGYLFEVSYLLSYWKGNKYRQSGTFCLTIILHPFILLHLWISLDARVSVMAVSLVCFTLLAWYRGSRKGYTNENRED